MSGEGVSLEQVLKQASSRAEEIRIEIATLKERVVRMHCSLALMISVQFTTQDTFRCLQGGGNPTSTVTVPQLLKGDAIPDVTEPEVGAYTASTLDIHILKSDLMILQGFAS